MATTPKKKPATSTKKKTAPKKQMEREMPEDIWEQLPNESADQYTKFCLYRDMAYDGKPEQDTGKGITFGKKIKKRSLQKLANELGLKTKRPLEQLSVTYAWGARCEAYDLDLERRVRQAHESAIFKMTEDHALLGAQMIRKATSRLLKIPEEEISAADLIRLADVGVKIERLSRGQSTENQNVSGSVARTLSGKWPRARAKVVENKVNGPAIVDLLKKEIAGMVEFNPKGSKEERAISVTPYFEAGNIHFPDPKTHPWVDDLIRDLLIFPKGTFKDTTDALVQGILYLMDNPLMSAPPKATTLAKESYWRE